MRGKENRSLDLVRERKKRQLFHSFVLSLSDGRERWGAVVCSVRPAFFHGIMFRVDRCATRVLEGHKGAHRGEEEAGVG